MGEQKKAREVRNVSNKVDKWVELDDSVLRKKKKQNPNHILNALTHV